MAEESTKLRLAVLASGQGTNLQAILDACQDGKLAAEVVLVISDQEQAFALERARQAGIAAQWLNPRQYKGRTAYDAALRTQLEAANVGLIVLAGFMRILGKDFVENFTGRIINLHPALLPSFPGLHAIEKAWQHGVRYTGCTVHFVDTGVDSGPIILQRVVEVLSEDSVAELEQRIHAAEHEILPKAIQLFAEGRLQMDGRRVIIKCSNP